MAASYASGQLDPLEAWVRGLSKIDVWRLLDATFSGGGVMRGDRLMRAVGEQLEDRHIESLPLKFAAVAADLETGKEVWLQHGPMLHAVRASSGLPGLFTPVSHEGRWLIDGGVVNPVPVSLCRAMGADYVIAVNLNLSVASRGSRQRPRTVLVESDDDSDSTEGLELLSKWSGLLENFVNSFRADRQENEPGMLEVMSTTINIMQDHITRSRMAGDPPDLTVTPRLGHFHLMDFHRAAEAIEIGHRAVQRVAAELAAIR